MLEEERNARRRWRRWWRSRGMGSRCTGVAGRGKPPQLRSLTPRTPPVQPEPTPQGRRHWCRLTEKYCTRIATPFQNVPLSPRSLSPPFFSPFFFPSPLPPSFLPSFSTFRALSPSLPPSPLPSFSRAASSSSSSSSGFFSQAHPGPWGSYPRITTRREEEFRCAGTSP